MPPSMRPLAVRVGDILVLTMRTILHRSVGLTTVQLLALITELTGSFLEVRARHSSLALLTSFGTLATSLGTPR